MVRKMSVCGALACALTLVGGQAWGAPFELNYMPNGSGIGFISGGTNVGGGGPDTFGYGNSDVDRLIQNIGPGQASTTTATVTAWTANSGDTDLATWSTSQLYGWPQGLGICNRGEGLINQNANSCSGNGTHSADNSGFKDFFIIEFSKPVVVTEATVTAWGSGNGTLGYDSSYWQGTGPAPDPTGQAGYGFLGTEQTQDQAAAANNNPVSFNLSGLSGGADWIVIGAKRAERRDGFKLKALEFATVPIPDAALLFGTGLLGFIVLARRKNLLKKS